MYLFEGVVNSKTDRKVIEKKDMILLLKIKCLLKKGGYNLKK